MSNKHFKSRSHKHGRHARISPSKQLIDLIDDLWIKSFSFLIVYDFCTIRQTCKRFCQATNPNNKTIRDYWQYQSILLGCNENYYDDIYDTKIKPKMTFFKPANNDWFKFYIEFRQALLSANFIVKISMKEYYNYMYNEIKRIENKQTKHKAKRKGKNKRDNQATKITILTFLPNDPKKPNNRLGYSNSTNPITIAKYMSRLIHFNVNYANDNQLTLAGYCCLNNHFQVMRYLLTWDKRISIEIENNSGHTNNNNNKNTKNNEQNKSTKAKSKRKVTRLGMFPVRRSFGYNEHSQTLLGLATKHKHYQLIKYLLTNEIVRNHTLCCAPEFQEALETNNMAIIQLYLDPNINIKLQTGKMKLNKFQHSEYQPIDSLLHHLCRKVKLNAIRMLLDTVITNKYAQWTNIIPLNINLRDRDGQTALMSSVSGAWFLHESELLEIVKLFLNEKMKNIIDLFILDNKQRSMFILAVKKNYYNIAVYIYNYFIKYYKCSDSYRKCTRQYLKQHELTMVGNFFGCTKCLNEAGSKKKNDRNDKMIRFLNYVQTATGTMNNLVRCSRSIWSESKSKPKPAPVSQNSNANVGMRPMLKRKPILYGTTPK